MGYHLAVVGRECQDRAEGGSVPTYQYTCTECGEPLEAVQKFSDDPLTVCPVCGGRLRKVFSAVGIVFKGSGFYRNDSRKAAEVGAGSGAAKANGSGEASADSAAGANASSTESGKSDSSSGKSSESSSGKSGESSSGKSGESSGKSSSGEKKPESAGAKGASSSTKVA